MKFLFVFLLAGMIATSCSDDDKNDLTPKIKNLEVGSGHGHGKENDAKAYIGKDLHLSADILAPNKIAKIEVVFHKEGEHHKHAEKHEEKEHKDKWGHFEFKDYNGQVNAKFHKHIDIPEMVTSGDYHFHFKVVDTKGVTAEIKKELKILEKPHK